MIEDLHEIELESGEDLDFDCLNDQAAQVDEVPNPNMVRVVEPIEDRPDFAKWESEENRTVDIVEGLSEMES
jgi:hypothetical protein